MFTAARCLALAGFTLVALAAPAAATAPERSGPGTAVTTPLRDTTTGHRAGVAPRRVAEKAPTESRDKININTADVKVLMSLTGIGRKVAEKIVEYRDSHGPFKKADEIRKVEGVGTGVWEKNRERIVIK